MVRMVTLTTEDNPFNPFEDYDEWNAFDVRKGYNTASYLARIVNTSIDQSPADYWEAIAIACEEIMKFNLTGNYRIVEYRPREG